MQQFLVKHSDKITATLSSFDRIVFKGDIRPLCWGGGLEDFLRRRRILMKDFKAFAQEQSEQVVAHAKTMAEKAGRRYI